jgi:hypothetical protein
MFKISITPSPDIMVVSQKQMQRKLFPYSSTSHIFHTAYVIGSQPVYRWALYKRTITYFFSVAQHPNSGLGRLIVEVSTECAGVRTHTRVISPTHKHNLLNIQIKTEITVNGTLVVIQYILVTCSIVTIRVNIWNLETENSKLLKHGN